MAWEKNRIKTPPLSFNGESGNIIAADEKAGRIKNMNMTPSNTLRAVSGPVEYIPSKYPGGQSTLTYGDPLLGIFHCKIEAGSRDIILAHFTGAGGSSNIYEYRTWVQQWVPIIGPNTTALYKVTLPQGS